MKNVWLKWFLVFAFWTLIGVFFAGQTFLTHQQIGNPVSWKFALGRNLADWYVFAVLSIPAFRLARRFRIEGIQWPRTLVIHLAASILFSASWLVLRAGIEYWQSRAGDAPVTFSAAFSRALFATFFINLLIYWVIVSVGHAVEYYRRYQARGIRAAELEKRLAEARLEALQMQLNPHFLFNTLHAISSLVHKDAEAADRMIARLSDLLRTALDTASTQEVPLRQELDFLRSYLEIEQTRFGDRLKVNLDIDPATLEARVPNLILQPLVENAIRHGIEDQAKDGILELRARRENGNLCVEVSDNGAGLPKNESPAERIGLSNTRARLRELYGARHTFELHNREEGGLTVRIRIPFRPEAVKDRCDP